MKLIPLYVLLSFFLGHAGTIWESSGDGWIGMGPILCITFWGAIILYNINKKSK